MKLISHRGRSATNAEQISQASRNQPSHQVKSRPPRRVFLQRLIDSQRHYGNSPVLKWD